MWLGSVIEYDIIIETLAGTEFQVVVTEDDTIGYIKTHIEKIEGIPRRQQHLIYNQRELNDLMEVKDVPLLNGSRIQLVLRLKGGPISATRRVLMSEIDKSLFGFNDVLGSTSWQDSSVSSSGVKYLVYKDCKRHIHRLMKLRSKTTENKNPNNSVAPLVDTDGQFLKDNLSTMQKMHSLRAQLEMKKNSKSKRRSRTNDALTLSCSSKLSNVTDNPTGINENFFLEISYDGISATEYQQASGDGCNDFIVILAANSSPKSVYNEKSKLCILDDNTYRTTLPKRFLLLKRITLNLDPEMVHFIGPIEIIAKNYRIMDMNKSRQIKESGEIVRAAFIPNAEGKSDDSFWEFHRGSEPKGNPMNGWIVETIDATSSKILANLQGLHTVPTSSDETISPKPLVKHTDPQHRYDLELNNLEISFQSDSLLSGNRSDYENCSASIQLAPNLRYNWDRNHYGDIEKKNDSSLMHLFDVDSSNCIESVFENGESSNQASCEKQIHIMFSSKLSNHFIENTRMTDQFSNDDRSDFGEKMSSFFDQQCDIDEEYVSTDTSHSKDSKIDPQMKNLNSYNSFACDSRRMDEGFHISEWSSIGAYSDNNITQSDDTNAHNNTDYTFEVNAICDELRYSDSKYQPDDSLFNINLDTIDDNTFEIGSLNLLETADLSDSPLQSVQNFFDLDEDRAEGYTDTSKEYDKYDEECQNNDTLMTKSTELGFTKAFNNILSADDQYSKSGYSKFNETMTLNDIKSAWNSVKTQTDNTKEIEQDIHIINTSPDASRCAECNKKLGIIMLMKCHCNRVFCPKHRYAEAHNCSFDFRNEGRRDLLRNNPLVIAPKLSKI